MNSRNEERLDPALYIVGTPIGNLEDITLRALRVLRNVDRIACEDTRQTQKLLNHYEIHTPTVSYHEHNEMTRAPELIVHLEDGESIALVTDAGMPAISDPGYRLITLAIRHHLKVVPVPGASAFLSALVASGFPGDSFKFSGFLPAKSGQRRKLLEEMQHAPRTLIFYEAPHRIIETLKDIVDVMGPTRHVVIAREVTKLHEEFLRGHVEDVLRIAEERGELKGEITLLIAKADENEPEAPKKESVSQLVERYMRDESLDEKDALKRVAREMGVSKSEAYRELQRTKK
ncbi:MAG TPA: 16S rRNA (cytidine(1402)-2'-O)-methyltransferase [Terriglobales bacterium]|nr:16S rRNA (cytidine(1402)-2'-O)-methyltransferase [Terriglobales bacterium]